MLACEIAAAMPVRVRKLILIDPLGLWRDDLPVRNWMILPEDQRRAALFADPTGPAAVQFFKLPADQTMRRGAGGLCLVAGVHRKVCLADPRQGSQEADSQDRCADFDRLGKSGYGDCAGLRP
jgi:hypothetical protein